MPGLFWAEIQMLKKEKGCGVDYQVEHRQLSSANM